LSVETSPDNERYETRRAGEVSLARARDPLSPGNRGREARTDGCTAGSLRLPQSYSPHRGRLPLRQTRRLCRGGSRGRNEECR